MPVRTLRLAISALDSTYLWYPQLSFAAISISLSLIVCRASIYARTIPGDLQQIVPRPGHPWRFWLMETDPRPAWAWGMDMHMDMDLDLALG